MFGFISRSQICRSAGTVIALWLLLIIVPAAINSNNG
jgi:MFS-type transporter involved in bile tolerance (Atg22 family)